MMFPCTLLVCLLPARFHLLSASKGPRDGRLPKNQTSKKRPDCLQVEYQLIFCNTVEELKLPIKGPMEDAGVIKLYEPLQQTERPVSMWPLPSTPGWAEYPLSHCC